MKKNEQISIEITFGTIVKTIVLLVAAVLLYQLRGLVLVILSAIVLASALEPGTSWLEKRRVPRLLAVIAIYLLLFTVAVGIVYFVVPTLLHEVALIINQLPRYIDSLQSTADEFSLLSFDLKTRLSELSEANITSIGDAISALGGGFIQGAGFLFGGMMSFLMIVVLSFYLAVQKNGVENFLGLVVHEDYEEYVLDLWRRSQHKIGLWMQGQLVLAFFMGIFVYLGLTALGVKYQLLLALLAMLCEVIPVFGPVMAAVPAIAIGLLDSGTTGLIVTGFYILIQQLENHIVYPLVVRKIVGVSPMVVILSLIIGGELAGFLGVLLAVPVATIFVEVMDDLEKHKTLRKAARLAAE